MKKKFLLSFMLMCISIFAFGMLNVSAYTGTKYGDYLYYSVSDGEVTITDCDSSATEIVIPKEIDDYPVTSIGDFAFQYCSNLTSVTIPNSVTSIGHSAFFLCSSLTSIKVDENNANYCSVDGNLFNKAKTELIQYAIGKSDTQYTIPFGVTNIGSKAFSYCADLTSLIIPDSVVNIGRGAFYNTGFYQNDSNWDNDVLYIGNYLIEVGKSLSGEYTVKNGTKCISDGAFSYCWDLTSITIPDSITSIGNEAFSSCSSLSSITIPNRDCDTIGLNQ